MASDDEAALALGYLLGGAPEQAEPAPPQQIEAVFREEESQEDYERGADEQQPDDGPPRQQEGAPVTLVRVPEAIPPCPHRALAQVRQHWEAALLAGRCGGIGKIVCLTPIRP